MKDVFAVLRQTEMDLARVRNEIQALRFVIPLLSEAPGFAAAVGEAFPSSSADNNKRSLELRNTPQS